MEVIKALKANPLTINDLVTIVEVTLGKQCPDDIARILVKMKKEGLIKSEFDETTKKIIWKLQEDIKMEK
ncbi:MAG: hypothetical protein QW520_07600 [Methanomassiliicoccales archaeon]